MHDIVVLEGRYLLNTNTVPITILSTTIAYSEPLFSGRQWELMFYPL